MLERWREPTFRFASVVEARCAVAQIRGTAAATETGALLQSLTDRGAAVLEFDQRDHGRGRVGLAHERDSGLLGTWIDLELQRLSLAALAVDQPNGERVHSVDAGAPTVE